MPCPVMAPPTVWVDRIVLLEARRIKKNEMVLGEKNENKCGGRAEDEGLRLVMLFAANH
jgi:hypothetical protein